MSIVNWKPESDVSLEPHKPLRAAVENAGHRLILNSITKEEQPPVSVATVRSIGSE